MACAKERCMVRSCDLRFPAALTELTVPKQPQNRGISLHRQRQVPVVVSFVPSSIQEGHVPHGPGLSLGVHDDLVPAVERDRGVVGVPDPATDIDARVPPHGAPAPALRLWVAGQDALVLRLGDAVGVAGADVDRLAARAVAEVGPMRLAAVAPAQWLVRQDQLLVHDEARDRQEEPLALTDEGGVLTAVAGLDLEALAGLSGLDLGGLESFLGLTDGADRGGFGDAGDEPVPLVVA